MSGVPRTGVAELIGALVFWVIGIFAGYVLIRFVFCP